MRDCLLALLSKREILGVVAATVDGLVIASVGVPDDDAERVAAAGSAFARTLQSDNGLPASLPLDGGRLVVTRQDEVMLIALTEPVELDPALLGRLDEALAAVNAQIRSDPVSG